MTMTREEYLRRRAELVADERRYSAKFWNALPILIGTVASVLLYSTFLTGAAYQRWKDAEQRPKTHRANDGPRAPRPGCPAAMAREALCRSSLDRRPQLSRVPAVSSPSSDSGTLPR